MSFNIPSGWDLNKLQNIKFKDDADTIAEDLIYAANNFNRKLDENHEVGIMLASFGQTLTVNVTGIGYQGAKLLKLSGSLADTGAPVELLQHVNQLNFLLVSLPRESTEEPKREIGFLEV